jgi:hypothetical protein
LYYIISRLVKRDVEFIELSKVLSQAALLPTDPRDEILKLAQAQEESNKTGEIEVKIRRNMESATPIDNNSMGLEFAGMDIREELRAFAEVVSGCSGNIVRGFSHGLRTRTNPSNTETYGSTLTSPTP